MEPVVRSMSELQLEVWKHYDEVGRVCPHHSGKWMENMELLATKEHPLGYSKPEVCPS